MILGLDGKLLPIPEFPEKILIEQEVWHSMETREITWKYRRADRPRKGDAPDWMTKEEAFESGFTITEKWIPGDS